MTDHYDVVVIGFGPVGQMMSTQLAQAGHSAVAFERHAQLYGLSRAGHIDDEIMRTLQKVGAGEEFREQTCSQAPATLTWMLGRRAASWNHAVERSCPAAGRACRG